MKQCVGQLGLALTVGLLRLFAVLPYGWVARLGHAVGTMLYAIPSSRKHIALVNLRLCFPDKSAREYDDLARAHFQHVIRSYFERGIQWFGSEQSLQKLVRIESRIDLEAQDAAPTIFLGFHFVSIEVRCILYSTRLPAASLYTRMSNERLCEVARRQRGRFGAQMIERSTSARKIVGLLRSGIPVMLAADMDHGIENSVFVPFFGVPACTLTSVSRLAKLAGARVVPFVTQVLPDYQGYKLTVYEPLSGFPSESDTLDASRINALLETLIRPCPEQYYWVHRRFKSRPAGEAGVY
ncbi:lipid A biosynthesis lauroyl acyltransferase [Caballeronia catudaia]|uniref:lipid A biosynthesis lauroyl acyltransferase n=1 Tax=Caballeronia catudaia TaxID=1777136 RepID=UPI000772D1D9|nr:lipid A biosynthesis lauroyl acyltransferase [Caballeronia catudaia]